MTIQLLLVFAAVIIGAFLIVAALARLTMKIYIPPLQDTADREITISEPRVLRMYQRLLVTSTVTLLLGAVLMYFPLPWPATWVEIRTDDGYGSLLRPFQGPIFVTFVLAGVAARVGMFFFELWARWLFAALYIVGWILSLLSGMTVLTPLESAIGMVGTLADGAIFILAYTRPLSRAFKTTYL